MKKIKLGVGLSVYLIATFLMLLLYIIGMLVGMFKSFYERQVGEGLKSVDYKLWYLAIMKDQTGNIVCKELFDWLLITKDSTNFFGSQDETISSVLGKNELAGTLSKTGLWLANKLNSIEPNHCINSINK